MMRIILPIERKLQSRPRFARRGNYVQTYEDRLWVPINKRQNQN